MCVRVRKRKEIDGTLIISHSRTGWVQGAKVGEAVSHTLPQKSSRFYTTWPSHLGTTAPQVPPSSFRGQQCPDLGFLSFTLADEKDRESHNLSLACQKTGHNNGDDNYNDFKGKLHIITSSLGPCSLRHMARETYLPLLFPGVANRTRKCNRRKYIYFKNEE